MVEQMAFRCQPLLSQDRQMNYNGPVKLALPPDEALLINSKYFTRIHL